MTIRVIKLGGNEIDSPGFLAEFARVVAAQSDPPLIVHGGGKEIAALQTQLGIEARFIDGLRVTDTASLQIVEMVLGGSINKRLVRTFALAGTNAIGLSGADLNLLRSEPLKVASGDLGFVGHVTQVNTQALRMFLSQRIVPVIAPIGFGSDGGAYNINADHVALAIAKALNADALLFVTNVPGVKIDGAVVPELTPDEAEAHIASGQISGGMIPKVRSAIDAIAAGVQSVVICDLDGFKRGGGTAVSKQSRRAKELAKND
jgi:acetylglutamate kinase